MREHGLKIEEVIPREARALWYLAWFRFTVVITVTFLGIRLFVNFVAYLISGSTLEGIDDMFFGPLIVGIVIGLLWMLVCRKWIWSSNEIAVRTLAEKGYCPNCGYIIRGLPVGDD